MDKKPNFFIAGAAKSGTTSLFTYVNLHPDVYMSEIKEPHYFCHDDFPTRFTGPGDEGFSENRLRTEEAYLKLFEPGQNALIRGEGSVYYIYFPDVAQRLMEFNPDSKVVLVLRNPIERAFSAYMHTVRDGRETLSFEEALKAESSRREQGYQPLWWYRELGLYTRQVERYQQVFPKDQLKIFLFEDLKDTSAVVADTLSFLGVDAKIPIDTSVKQNESGVPKSRFVYDFFAKPNGLKEVIKPMLPEKLRQRLGQQAKSMTLRKETMNPETRMELKEFYRDDIAALQDVLGRDLSNWMK